MLRFFRKSPPLDSAVVDWQFDCFAWLLRNSGGFNNFRETVLVQPTNHFFPQRGLHGHALATAIFEQVRRYAGMDEWPCRLEPQDEDPNPVVAPAVVIQGTPLSAAGTFSASEEGAVITYNPSSLGDSMSLVATFAHELAHFLTGGFPDEPPGGWDSWEFATDLASVFLGFGIFAANSCFGFSQYTTVDSQGWYSRQQGYLSEQELLYAQAIFSALLDISPEEVRSYLRPALRPAYARACRAVSAESERIELLRGIE